MKKYLLAMGAVVVTGSLLAVGTASGDLDLPYLQQRLDNHEARITNSEQDIQALQATTSTAPTAHVDVPPAPAYQTATPAPTAAPVAATPAPAPVSAAPTEAPAPTPAATPMPPPECQISGGHKVCVTN